MTTVRHESELMFQSEVAAELRTTRAKVKEWIASGAIATVVNPDGRRLVPRSELRALYTPRHHNGHHPTDRAANARPERMRP